MAKAQAKRITAKANDPTSLGRNFKKRLRTGGVLLGGMVYEYLRPSIVKIYAHAGFDFIYLENEHALFDGPAFADFVLAARDNNLPVIAKIGQLERSETARLLESGVVGIQLPRTESAEELKTLIDYMKFPPSGTRAGAPVFGNVDYIWPTDDRAWLKKADESTAVVAQIETARGYENAEEIIATENVDVVYVGPYDFSISMGHPGEPDHPVVKKAIDEILSLCLSHGVAFGISASSTRTAGSWIRRGCRFFEVIDEMSMINSAATEIVEAYRKHS